MDPHQHDGDRVEDDRDEDLEHELQHAASLRGGGELLLLAERGFDGQAAAISARQARGRIPSRVTIPCDGVTA